MGHLVVEYRKGSLPDATADTDSGPSPNIWADCPVAELIDIPGRGYYFFDDFMSFIDVDAGAEADYGRYLGFADTGGTVAFDTDVLSGGAVFSSDGDNEGASIRTNPAFLITQDGGEFWFEARFKTSTIADTKHGIFCGLMEDATLTATVPIAADGTIADQNLVGFHRLEGDGDKMDTIYKADGVTAVTVKADAVTLVADTYKKIGMKYKRTDHGNSAVLTFYDDGQALADTKTIPDNTGTDFPADAYMGLVFAVLNATGSTPGNSSLDWWRAAQIRLS